MSILTIYLVWTTWLLRNKYGTGPNCFPCFWEAQHTSFLMLLHRLAISEFYINSNLVLFGAKSWFGVTKWQKHLFPGAQSSWFLKKGTSTFNFRSSDPFPDLLGTLVQYDHPWKNKIKSINTLPSCSSEFFFLQNFTFVGRSLKRLQ
jgi:hypothetical protein